MPRPPSRHGKTSVLAHEAQQTCRRTQYTSSKTPTTYLSGGKWTLARSLTPPTHSLTHSLPPLTHSPTHSLTPSLTHIGHHALAHSTFAKHLISTPPPPLHLPINRTVKLANAATHTAPFLIHLSVHIVIVVAFTSRGRYRYCSNHCPQCTVVFSKNHYCITVTRSTHSSTTAGTERNVKPR